MENIWEDAQIQLIYQKWSQIREVLNDGSEIQRISAIFSNLMSIIQKMLMPCGTAGGEVNISAKIAKKLNIAKSCFKSCRNGMHWMKIERDRPPTCAK